MADSKKQEILTPDLARDYLKFAESKNPGRWVDHSLYAAKAARALAPYVNIDPDEAEACALIHDLGRMDGPDTRLRHIYAGYEFLVKEGYPKAAAVCLTHSFPHPKVDVARKVTDLKKDEYELVKAFIDRRQMTAMDKLIQLSDAISVHTGFVVMERRLIDVGIRYGVRPDTLRSWQSFRDIQAEFEEKIGGSIYSVLPGYKKLLDQKLKDAVVF